MPEQTYHPILREEEYANNPFSPIPFPTPNCAIILTAHHAEAAPLVILANSVPSKKQIRQGRYDRQTTVDLQRHTLSFEMDLLSADHVSKFHVTLSMSAQVNDPYRVFTASIKDVAAYAKSVLSVKLQDRACRHHASELQPLREEVLALLGAAFQLECGISLNDFGVLVEADQTYAQHLKQLRDLQYKEEYEQVRSEKAKSISNLYPDPVTRAFAEVASGGLSVSEAADQIRKSSAGDFDEAVRRAGALLAMMQQAQENGLGAPPVFSENAERLLSTLTNQVAPSAGGTASTLGSGSSKQELYALPAEDECN